MNTLRTPENFSGIRKKSALVADYVDTIPPSSPVKKIKNTLFACRTADDPRPILDFACKLLERVTNDRGNTLLHEGILAENRSLCKLSVKIGFVNRQNNAGETPLHVAIRTDWAYGVTLILKNNPDLLLQNNQGLTPLELAEELDRPYFINQLLNTISALDQAVPVSRHYRFLGSIWFRGNKECISAVAKIILPKSNQGLYEYRFDSESRGRLAAWIHDPTQDANLVTFSFARKVWNNILYHFAGKQALLFTKDRKVLRLGSYEEKMYTVMLWTWRNYWQKMPAEEQSPYQIIDRAIANAINPPSNSDLVKKIRSGKTPVIIPTGWHGHSLTAVFSKNWLFICNRGRDYLSQEFAFTAYRIDRKAITAKLLQQFKKTERADASVFLSSTLPKALGATQDSFCEKIHTPSLQPSRLTKPICVAANMRLAIFAILLSNSKKVNDQWDFSKATIAYKDYVLSARFMMLHRYLQRD